MIAVAMSPKRVQLLRESKCRSRRDPPDGRSILPFGDLTALFMLQCTTRLLW